MLQLIRNHPSNMARIWPSKAKSFFLFCWPGTFFTKTVRSTSTAVVCLHTHATTSSTSLEKKKKKHKFIAARQKRSSGSGSREYNTTLYSWPETSSLKNNQQRERESERWERGKMVVEELAKHTHTHTKLLIEKRRDIKKILKKR